MPPSNARAAIVTGGARGIGLDVCQALAGDGIAVTVADLDADACHAAAAQLPGGGHHGVAANVTSQDAVAALFDAAAAHHGAPPAILVACAGILILQPGGKRTPIAETPLADWQRTMDVNATGCFLCCREYARRAVAGRDGRVVTVSSVAAELGGYRASAAYIASKGAVLAFTKALARELAPLGVTANCVAPGLIDAPMLRLSLDPADDAQAAAGIPLGRLGLADDVAHAVRFLVSPGAAYQTGTTMDVNGGYRMA